MRFTLLGFCLWASVHSSPTRRDTVALWDACDYPSMGINGPLQCAPGSECICKDATYSQCRKPIDGVWSYDPSWQCQKPGDTPSGTLDSISTNTSTSTSSEPSSSDSSSSTGSSEPISSDTSSSTGSSDVDSGGSSLSGGLSNLGQSSGSGDSTIGGASKKKPAASGSSPALVAAHSTAPSPGSKAAPALGSMPASNVAAPEMYANASASVGGCSGLAVPDGWDGVASTSYYGYMGTSCMCGDGEFGQASWQANTGESLGIGQGIYSGAVNQKLFRGTLNSAGQPGCGSSCGVCYELMTTGVNAYNNGIAGGSTIQMMVVDACYNNAGKPNWCSSNTDSGEDDFGCGVHFDIDTDPTQGDVPVIGQDGTTWTNGGQMVLYRRTACPPEMTDAFNQDCKSHC